MDEKYQALFLSEAILFLSLCLYPLLLIWAKWISIFYKFGFSFLSYSWIINLLNFSFSFCYNLLLLFYYWWVITLLADPKLDCFLGTKACPPLPLGLNF